MSTRGQFEIMGLAILVVLIMFAVLFFMTREPKDSLDITQSYEYALLAQSTVDVFLRTDVENCPQYTMQDLVRDAAITQSNPCGDDPNSAAILRATAEAAIGNSTGSRYDFSISIDGENLENLRVEQCPKGKGARLERSGEARIRLFPTTQTALVSLQFCPQVRT